MTGSPKRENKIETIMKRENALKEFNIKKEELLFFSPKRMKHV